MVSGRLDAMTARRVAAPLATTLLILAAPLMTSLLYPRG
jgi:hypothetical protein